MCFDLQMITQDVNINIVNQLFVAWAIERRGIQIKVDREKFHIVANYNNRNDCL